MQESMELDIDQHQAHMDDFSDEKRAGLKALELRLEYLKKCLGCLP